MSQQFDAEVNPVRLTSLSPWHQVRDAISDTTAALGVTIAAGVVVLLPVAGWQSAGLRRPFSPSLILGIFCLTELSFLYFGFRRMRANQKKGVPLKLLEGNTWRGVLSGIPMGIAWLTIDVVYIISVRKLFHWEISNPIQILGHAKGSLPLSLTLVLTLAILAPACEEFFFRGVVFGSAQAIGRAGLGAVVGSVLFAMVHVSLVLSANYILFSLTMCWLLAKCRTLVAPIAAHMTVNAAACVVMLR